MKKRILSLVLTFVMILTMVPVAFAGDKGADALLELLPGNESVTGLFLEVLNGLMPGGEGTSEQEIKEMIDKEYSGPYATAGYVPDENSYYVSLGDSTITGMGTDDPAYGNYGYKTKVPASAPYQAAQALGVDYVQLAMAGLRTTDLRYILDASFKGDQYTELVTNKRIVEEAKSSIDQMRNDYMTELQKADLITVSIGNCNFSDFVKAQIYGAIAELLNEQLYDVLNKGLFASMIKEKISAFIDLDSKTYEMNWEGYLGAEGKAKLEAALADLEAKLIEGGVPENYPLDLAEMAGEAMDMTLPSTVKDKLKINIPMAELMVYVMECFLYGYATFVVDFEAAFDKIHEIAPNAELLVLGMYNPADKLVFTFSGQEIAFGEYYGYMAKSMSLYFQEYAETTENTTFVDVYNTESKADADDGTYDLMTYMMSLSEKINDFYATPAGHTYMKNQIMAALASEAEGLLGDADGSGVVDYVDAMLVLQYHTGVIGNEGLAAAWCDVDRSGAVDYVDAMLILQYHTGVISGF